MYRLTLLLFIMCLFFIQLNASNNTLNFAGANDSSLIAYYTFTGNPEDSSGNGNHGTNMGAILTSDRFGNQNSAYEFNGTSSYISIPSSSTLKSPTEEITINAWVQVFDWSLIGASFAPVLMKSNSGTNAFQYRLAVTSSGINMALNNWNTAATSDSTIPFYNWNMISFTFKNDTVRFYQNGRFITIKYLPTNIIADDRPLEIGRDVPGITEIFFGKIDDIRIYNRALSEDEIATFYTFIPAEPQALEDLVMVQEDSTVQFNLLRNDYHPQGDSLFITGYTLPQNGSLEQLSDSVFAYTPYIDYFGPDSFSYYISDENDLRDTGYVFININGRNDAPEDFSLLFPADGSVFDTTIIEFSWQRSSDADYETLNYTLHVNNAQKDTSILGLSDTTVQFDGSVFFEDNQMYDWFVEVSDGHITVASDTFFFSLSLPSGIHSKSYIPKRFELFQNYPNPFNPNTTIVFQLARSEEVILTLYDVTGQEVKSLIQEKLPAGEHRIIVSADDLPSGLYFYNIQAGSFSDVKKMILLR